MEKIIPFCRIEEISTEFGEATCGILTVLASEEHGLEELGEDIEGGSWNISAERDEWRRRQERPRDAGQERPQEVPPGLDLDVDMEAMQPPVSPEAVAVPAERSLQSSLTLYEGFTVTRESTIRDLCAVWKGVRVFQSRIDV